VRVFDKMKAHIRTQLTMTS